MIFVKLTRFNGKRADFSDCVEQVAIACKVMDSDYRIKVRERSKKLYPVSRYKLLTSNIAEPNDDDPDGTGLDLCRKRKEFKSLGKLQASSA